MTANKQQIIKTLLIALAVVMVCGTSYGAWRTMKDIQHITKAGPIPSTQGIGQKNERTGLVKNQISDRNTQPAQQSIEEKNNHQEQERVNLSTGDSRDWPFYTDKNHGLELLLPPTLKGIREVPVKKPYIKKIKFHYPCRAPLETIPQARLKVIPDRNIRDGIVECGDTILEIGVAENPSVLAIEDWIRAFLISRYGRLSVPYSKFILGRIKGVKIEYLPVGAPVVVGGCQTYFVPIIEQEVLSIGFCVHEALYCACSDMKEEILSSLRLLR